MKLDFVFKNIFIYGKIIKRSEGIFCTKFELVFVFGDGGSRGLEADGGRVLFLSFGFFGSVFLINLNVFFILSIYCYIFFIMFIVNWGFWKFLKKKIRCGFFGGGVNCFFKRLLIIIFVRGVFAWWRMFTFFEVFIIICFYIWCFLRMGIFFFFRLISKFRLVFRVERYLVLALDFLLLRE